MTAWCDGSASRADGTAALEARVTGEIVWAETGAEFSGCWAAREARPRDFGAGVYFAVELAAVIVGRLVEMERGTSSDIGESIWMGWFWALASWGFSARSRLRRADRAACARIRRASTMSQSWSYRANCARSSFATAGGGPLTREAPPLRF